MNTPSFARITLLLLALQPCILAAQWPTRQADLENTGRAPFAIPTNRMGTNFFLSIRWQKPAPGSPGEGGMGSSSMPFFDGAGPNGADLVVGTYHWPKGVQGMNRHTGERFWYGNPDGGESIGDLTPAFSADGQALYVANDASSHPLMAFASSVGPGVYWHNGADTNALQFGGFTPVVAPDGRIFSHSWNDRPRAALDAGSALAQVWEADADVCECLSDPALWVGPSGLRVVASGRCGRVVCFDGNSGATIWSAPTGIPTDASPTIDPATGNTYVAAGVGDVYVVGVDANGNPLWTTLAPQVYAWQEGVNNPQRAQSPGCLSFDGTAYYFQTTSSAGDGALYAINTADGSIRWVFQTGSRADESRSSSPIVTPNNVIVVGNNAGGIYYALRDDLTQATLLASLPVADGGNARASATLSPDGLLYLPVRMTWTSSNGDNDVPTQQPAKLFVAFDLTESPQVLLPAPAGLHGHPLDGAVELGWVPIADPSGQFSHYAVYRNNVSFTSIEGMIPLATLANLAADAYLDSSAANGMDYYYAVTSVSLSGTQVTNVVCVGPFRPVSETDLQVVSIARTPRFPRYAPIYTGYSLSEPSGFGPYSFTAATGLGDGQTASTKHWPDPDEPVTYTVTIRNRGTTTWTGSIQGEWRWDGTVIDQPVLAGPLAPGATNTCFVTRNWDTNAHEVRFTLKQADARPQNNTLAVSTKSVGFLTYIDESFYEKFRSRSTAYPQGVTDDLIDWLNRHMTRFNEMFAEANCPKRVHYDILALLPDTAPDPDIDRQPFAIFPFRYHASEGDPRLSGYYHAEDDIDYGLLHEMGHQLGLIDLYQLDVPSEANLVSGRGYNAVDCLMRGCSPMISEHSALAMTHWLDVAHGYFGQYLYGIPSQLTLRFLAHDGQRLRGATVKMYQYCERPGQGKVITAQVKAQGVTDANGLFALPNVPLDLSKVPPLQTGDVLRDNPFGYVAVIGANGVLHFKVEYEGSTDYAWFDITEANVAYYRGQTNSATFDRQLTLGGPIQRFPPPDMAESNAAFWQGWAQGGVPGASYVEQDSTRVHQGANSLKFTTDGGFDTCVRYPAGLNAQWDLTSAQFLHFWAYAVNNNIGFQSGSPWVRLIDSDGNYFEYAYYSNGDRVDLLNEARNTWREFRIPLNASATEPDGWRRATVGPATLSRVNFLEIHADTWGYGFELWLDGVGFEPTPRPAVSVAHQPGAVVMSWPSSSPSWVLQSAPEPAGPYTSLNITPADNGQIMWITIPPTNTQSYFRLASP